MKIGINGMGRIGRCVLRAVFENELYSDIEVVKINSPSDIEMQAHLLQYDSIHGRFKYDVVVNDDKKSITINGKRIELSFQRNINDINWSGVDVVMECSGVFNSREKSSLHVKDGVKGVILSAPAKEKDVPVVIYKVNNEILQNNPAKVISIGSCTTNCLAPVAKVLNDALGIEKGFMTTIHAYTGDQNILDGSHKKDFRRARSAALSMIPTSTGAAKAIGVVIPALAGKLDGVAIRVPTPNVSMIDLSFVSSKNTTIEEVNQLFTNAAANDMSGVLGVCKAHLVSSDFIHTDHSSIVDLPETKVVSKNFVRVASWYDNEWAFSLRMLDVVRLWI